MNNPIEFMKAIRNPQEFIMNYAKTNTNPMLSNLIQMAQKGDKQGVENFARNFFKEQGQDFSEIEKLFK